MQVTTVGFWIAHPVRHADVGLPCDAGCVIQSEQQYSIKWSRPGFPAGHFHGHGECRDNGKRGLLITVVIVVSFNWENHMFLLFAHYQYSAGFVFTVILQGITAMQRGGVICSIQLSISMQDRAALNIADDIFTIDHLFLNLVNIDSSVHP